MSALLGCVTSVSSLGANPPHLAPPPAVSWPVRRLVNVTRRLKAFSLRKLYRRTVKACGALPRPTAETASAALWPRGRHWISITLCLFPAAEMLFRPFFTLLLFFSLLFFYVPNSRTSLFGIVVFCSRWALSAVREFDPSLLCIHGIMVGWAADQIGSERGESVLFHFLGTDGWQYFCFFTHFFFVCLTRPQLFLPDSLCSLSLIIPSWSLSVRRWRPCFLWTSLAAVVPSSLHRNSLP